MKNYILQWGHIRLPYFWHHYFVHEVYEKKMVENIMGFQEKDFFAYSDGEKYGFYLSEGDIELASHNYKEFFYDDEKLNFWKDEIDKLSLIVDKIGWDVLYSDTLVEVKKLLELFEKGVALHLVSQPHNTDPMILDLKSEMRELHTINENDLLNGLLKLDKLPNVMIERKEWIALIKSKLSKGFLEEKLEEHYTKWKYLSVGDGGELERYSDFRARFEEDKKNLNFELEENIEQVLRIRNECEEHLTKKGRKIAHIIREVSFLRFKTKAIWMKLWFIIEKNMDFFFVKNGRCLWDYIIDEFRDVNLEQNDRKKYLYIHKYGVSSLYYNSTYNNLLSSLPLNKSEVLVGTVGFRNEEINNICGEVIVVENVREYIYKEKDFGKILVVPQTTPAILPILLNFTAIIADEGGIAGHASVITREYKIPSIVGTYVATQILRSGDVVSMNFLTGEIERKDSNG